MLEAKVGRRSFLVGAGTLFAAAACGGGSSGSGDTSSGGGSVSGKVTMWIYPIDPKNEAGYWTPKKADFKKQYPDVDVDVVVQPWANRDEQLTTAIAGGKAPDVVYLIPDQLPQYADTGALADVSDVVSADKDDFRPSTLTGMTYKDKLYGVPLLMSATTLIVNDKILKAAGVSEAPKTWDDVLAAAPKIKSAGYYVTEYDGAADATLNLTFYPLLWQAGGEVLSADGKKAAFNSDAGVAAVTFVKKLVDGGYVPKDALTATQTLDASAVGQGKVAFMLAGEVSTLSAAKALNLADFSVHAPLKDKKSISYGTVGGLCVLDSAKSKSAAKAWVKWATSTDQMKAFDQAHKYFAPRKSVGALFANDALTGAEEKTLDDMTVGLVNPQARQLMDLIKPQIQAALLGRSSPKDALDKAATDVNALLARGH